MTLVTCYGVMLMLTGDDYDYVELKRYADHLTRELELVDGVGKVASQATNKRCCLLRCHLERLAALNLDMNVTVWLVEPTKQCGFCW